MYFGILGPLTVLHEQARIDIAGVKRRSLLIALLANANRLVTVERLTAWMWPSGPPRSASMVIQAHVSALRQALEPDRTPRAVPELLRTSASGYLIQLRPEQLDVSRFEEHLHMGTRLLAQGSAAQAAEVLRQGLAIWRGAALCDVRELPAAQTEVTRLDELWQTATVCFVDARLQLRRFAEVIPQLTVLIADFPYHERFYAQLMTALAASGRRAEALAIFRRARARLADDLGVEPGPDLQLIETSILRGEI